MIFLDFFAGIGGFRMGMERAGHKCAGFIEIDKPAVRSYRAIFGEGGDEYYADDIRNVIPGDLPEADCWCGGFPCQSYSQAGRRAGFADTRGTLIFEVFRLAAARRPRVLFLENVAGLLNHDSGRTFGTILTALAELGYHVEWQCINSKAYVPQNRERIFIIGYYGGFPERQVFPIPQKHGTALKEVIGGSQGSRIYDPAGVSPTLTAGGGGLGSKCGLYLVAASGDEVTVTEAAPCLDANYAKGILAGQARAGVLEVRPIITPAKENVRQNGRRVKAHNEEMYTLTTTDRHGLIIGAGATDGYRIRRLTPRECWKFI